MPRVLVAMLGVALTAPAHAADVQVEGFYRARARAFSSLTIDPSVEDAEGLSAWAQHRLWVRPRFILSDKVSVVTDIRGLDGVTFGNAPLGERNPGDVEDGDTLEGALPTLFTDDLRAPGAFPSDGLPRGVPNIELWRAWGEVHGKAGTFRFGRMPVQWGLGVWQNDGLGLNADYGDSADRVQWDRAFEDIFVRAAVEVDGYALAGGAEARDTFAGNAAVAWRSERLEVGLNAQVRHAFEADAGFTLATGSVALEAEIGNLHVGAEVVGRYGGGNLGAQDNLKVQAVGGVAVGELEMEKLTLGVEAGFASGDADPTDETITTFWFDRDYNLGVVMFEQPLPVFRTPDGASRDLSATLSGNGISNAIFGRAQARYRLHEDVTADVAVAVATAMKQANRRGGQSLYGVELDVGARYEASEHVDLSARVPLFIPGNYYTGWTDAELAPEGLSGFVVGAQVIGRIHF